MYSKTIKQFKTALRLFIVVTMLTGIIYPAIVTIAAQLLCPWKANGSIISQNNIIVGSELIGQSFTRNDYFWGRPSATAPFPYNAENSSGSNLGPSSNKLLSLVISRISLLRKTSTNNQQMIPIDLVTSSASGLDPEISPLSAYYQVPRIAKTRHLSEKSIQQLIQHLEKSCAYKLFGEPRVNVLALNLALDNLSSSYLQSNVGGRIKK